MTVKTNPGRPTQIDVEWDVNGEFCNGVMQMHPTQDVADVRIIGSFTLKDVAKLKRFGKWLIRAAMYMEQR